MITATLETIDTQSITQRAHARLMHQLRDVYKTNPTERETSALHCLLEHYTELASGQRTGRYAWGMPCGSAKTQSVVFGCAELLRSVPGFSVAIAVSQVTMAKKIKSDMVAAGVPANSIGILSPKEEDSGEPSIITGETYPIVLVTHARIHMGPQEIPRYWKFDGHARSFLIHDESLVSSHATTLDTERLEEGLVMIHHKVTKGSFAPTYGQQLLSFLQLQWNNLQGAFAGINYTISQTAPLFDETDDAELRQALCKLDNLPEALVLDDLKEILGKCEWTGADDIAGFLQLCGSTVRCIVSKPDKTAAATRHHLISYTVTVPEEIQNMVILDASAPVRHLASLDKTTITLAEELPSVNAAGITNLATIKNYSHVKFYRYNAGAGYSTMQKDKANLKIKDAVRLLETKIGKGEAVLFFTFPQRHARERALMIELRKELLRKKYDLDALYRNDPQNPQAKMIELTTWGKETSFNGYVHCSHVILLGTPHQNPLTIRATIHGQKRDIKTIVSDELLDDILKTEIVYRMHQAFGRGSCRANDLQGMARPMTGYYFHNSTELDHELGQIMPGATFSSPMVKVEQKSTVGERLEPAIVALLGLLTMECSCSISMKSFKQRVSGGMDVHPRMFSNALDSALLRCPEWKRVGRRLERIS